ncbi:thioredoxin family protein [Sedimenticola sp.]|uniref:thioredoxin family protein n=1 Tax=Sedimenticola sp. TaxID=1940285 RepID=UPI003D0FBCF0
MKPIPLFVLLTLLAMLPFRLNGAPLPLPKVTDWSVEAASAHNKATPLMVIFSSENCSYCQALNREILAPLLKKGTLQRRVHLREFSIDRGGKVIDFDGTPIRAHLFVDRYHVFATPTLILLDQSGKILGEPIVGYNGADSYPHLLDQAVQHANGLTALVARHRDSTR